jgi:hypothetical protein
MIDDWDYTARQLGYKDERDLFQRLYVEEGRSISMLAQMLKSGTATISRRLDMLEISKRPRGGDNNSGRQMYKLTHLDQRVVLTLPLNLLPELTKISRSLWYKYRRFRGEPNGLLHFITTNGVGEVQPIIEPPSNPPPDQTPKIHQILPGEEG